MTYLDQFDAVFTRSSAQCGADFNPGLLAVATGTTYGADVVDEVVADFKDGVVKSALELPGNCFAICRDASCVLFEAGIDHVVTIGNVTIEGSAQFDVTQDIIDRQILQGYVPLEPANAHCWLTLDSGQVLDPTILPSWAFHHDGGRELPLDEAIFLSGLHGTPAVVHWPMLTGFAFHLGVVTHPSDRRSYVHEEWMQHSMTFKRNIFLARQRA